MRILRLLNYIGFYLIWFFTLWGVERSQDQLVFSVVIIYLLFHLLLVSRKPFREFLLVVFVIAIGGVIDFTLASLDVVVYQNPILNKLPPIWLTALWAAFGSTYWHSFYWLQGRYVLGSFLSAVSAPFLYVWCEKAGVVVIKATGSIWLSYCLISFVWAVFFPITLWGGVALDSERID